MVAVLPNRKITGFWTSLLTQQLWNITWPPLPKFGDYELHCHHPTTSLLCCCYSSETKVPGEQTCQSAENSRFLGTSPLPPSAVGHVCKEPDLSVRPAVFRKYESCSPQPTEQRTKACQVRGVWWKTEQRASKELGVCPGPQKNQPHDCKVGTLASTTFGETRVLYMDNGFSLCFHDITPDTKA